MGHSKWEIEFIVFTAWLPSIRQLAAQWLHRSPDAIFRHWPAAAFFPLHRRTDSFSPIQFVSYLITYLSVSLHPLAPTWPHHPSAVQHSARKHIIMESNMSCAPSSPLRGNLGTESARHIRLLYFSWWICACLYTRPFSSRRVR
jgi:hypothetical protein